MYVHVCTDDSKPKSKTGKKADAQPSGSRKKTGKQQADAQPSDTGTMASAGNSKSNGTEAMNTAAAAGIDTTGNTVGEVADEGSTKGKKKPRAPCLNCGKRRGTGQLTAQQVCKDGCTSTGTGTQTAQA